MTLARRPCQAPGCTNQLPITAYRHAKTCSTACRQRLYWHRKQEAKGLKPKLYSKKPARKKKVKPVERLSFSEIVRRERGEK